MVRKKEPCNPDRVAALVEEQKVLHAIAWDLLKRYQSAESMVDYWRGVAGRDVPLRTEEMNALLSGYVHTLDGFASRWEA